MINALYSFISDIFVLLAPEMAIAGGVPFPPHRGEEKEQLFLAKGAGGFLGTELFAPAPKAPSVSLPPVPVAPTINIPAAPTPPATPVAPSSSAVDIAMAQQQGAAQAGAGFGFQGSLLKAPIGAAGQTGPNGTVNSATGVGSLLGR